MDPIYRQSHRSEGRTRKDCEVWDHFATTWNESTNSEHQSTKAECCTLGSGLRITNNDKTGRAPAVQKNPGTQSAFEPLNEPGNLLTLGELPCQKKKESSEEQPDTSISWTWSNWRWHELSQPNQIRLALWCITYFAVQCRACSRGSHQESFCWTGRV